jgi:hypothetical protein
MCPYFGYEAPLDNKLTLGNALIYPMWLGVSFAKCLLLSQLKHLTLDRSRFAFLTGNSLFANFSLLF